MKARTQQQVEAVALNSIRPHHRKWAAPLDVMRLPPSDCAGFSITYGEIVTLTRGDETYTFSLKKLWVILDKEAGRAGSNLTTPRALAKWFIYTSVEMGNDVKHIANSAYHVGWYGYSVGIGGRIPGKNGKPRWLDCWHILVDEFEGEKCQHIFDLRELYREIKEDIKRGYTIVQPTLF